MPNYQRRIVYLSEAQREELFSNGSITVNGTTITYDANDMYVTPQEEPYVKPASGIPASDLASGVVPDLTNYVQNTDYATSDNAGVVKVLPSRGIMINSTDKRIQINPATSSQIKESSSDTLQPIVPGRQDQSVFYGLAKAAGDTTQASSSNAVGTYTDTAKAAIQTMLGVPSSSDLNDKVDKSAIEDAGITGYTYSTLFGGQFSVTTVASNDYISPYARASVTGRISKHYMHRVTFNGTEYILPTRLWYDHDNGSNSIKVYEYLGNLNLFISDVSGIPGGTDNVPFVIISDLNNSSSIDVLTSTAGTYTIKVEKIVPTKKSFPKALIYGDNYAPIEKHNNGGTYNGFSIGVNELKNTRATVAIGYGNKTNNAFSTVIGIENETTYEHSYAIGENNSISGGYAFGRTNMTNLGIAIGDNNACDGPFSYALGYGLSSKTGTVALGTFNTEIPSVASWQENTLYNKGDLVTRAMGPFTFMYKCLETHTSSSTFTSDLQDNKWEASTSFVSDTLFLIGNGEENARSNAVKVSVSGNAYFNGDVYAGCNADSSGGVKLASQTDLNDKADKSNTILSTTLSLGRKANTTIGTKSIALGDDLTASGAYSFAEGRSTSAGGTYAHAMGYNTNAPGRASLAAGITATASGEASFAFGRGIASYGSYMAGFGIFPIVPTTFANWTANTSYNIGDLVKNDSVGYKCIEANSDATFTASKWQTVYYSSDIAFFIGNGTSSNDRSNALKIDIDGNMYIKKDVYVNCNADSTGGTKLESGMSFVETVSGTTPSITGEPNTRYMCGEVTSIAITSPSAGAIDIVFTSGSTPAVLTVTPPTGMTMKWPAWFDPTSLATNTTYEINIMDGVYGAVMTW